MEDAQLAQILLGWSNGCRGSSQDRHAIVSALTGGGAPAVGSLTGPIVLLPEEPLEQAWAVRPQF